MLAKLSRTLGSETADSLQEVWQFCYCLFRIFRDSLVSGLH